jgi:4-amino-4-deoxy-L-arabinose transferase-like glycosyltransferase
MIDERWRTHLLACLLFLSFVALVSGPLRMAFNNTPTWQDEAFYAEPARELALHGRLRAPIFGDVRGLSEVFALQPPVTFLERALVFKLFGFGKRQIRIASVLEFAACIVLLFGAVWRSTRCSPIGKLCAVAAALLFGTDSDVVRAATSGRPDMLGVALGLAALGCAVEATRREQAGLWLVGLGAFSALSGSSHPVMLALSPGAALVCLLAMPTSQRVRSSLLFSAGWLLGMVPWSWQIARHPEAWNIQFFDHFRGAYAGGSARVDEQSFPLQNLFRHVGEIGDTPYVRLAALTGLALGVAYANRTQRTLVLFGLSALLGLLPGETFVKVMAAFIYAAAAVGWASAFATTDLKYRRVAWLLAALLLVQPVVRNARLIARRIATGRISNEKPIADLIARYVPTDAIVVSHPVSYFALKEHGAEQLYPNCLQALRYARSDEDRAAHDASLLRKRPQFLLLDEGMKPESVGDLAQHASFAHLGTAKNPQGKGLTPRDEYEVRLYRVDYRQTPGAADSAAR